MSRSFLSAFSLIASIAFFPSLSLADEKENNVTDRSTNVFGVYMDKDGYISVPKEGKNNLDEQKQNTLIKAYEKQQQDFIRQQEQKLKEGFQ